MKPLPRYPQCGDGRDPTRAIAATRCQRRPRWLLWAIRRAMSSVEGAKMSQANPKPIAPETSQPVSVVGSTSLTALVPWR